MVHWWSETMLWEVLRDRQLHSVKFRRQFVIGSFIVDFYAPRQRLIIETQHERDTERQRLLESAGYRMLRISAEDVEADISAVLSTISTYVISPSLSPYET